MKKFVILFAFLFVPGLSIPAYAGSFTLGEETKGATVTTDDSDLNIRIRMQPRIDYGDLIESEDGELFESDSDIYLRRLRIEMSGQLYSKVIKYNLTFSGDKWEQKGSSNKVNVFYAYTEAKINDSLSVMVGKEKLPYSRVSLSSSSKQLLIERPSSTEAAKKIFGPTDAYYQPKLAFKGNVLNDVVSYEIAFADGWQNGDKIYNMDNDGLDRKLQNGGPLYIARIEVSPPGWIEKKKSDAHLGKDRHIALGVNFANQGSIEYKESDYEENRTLTGLDLSGHYKGITAQFEYNEWKIDTDDPALSDRKPGGWYLQAGYFMEGLNIEPVVRYEDYDQDSKADSKGEKNTTAGVNWYAKGHSLKVGLNWIHTEYEKGASGKPDTASDETDRDIYQVQVQMYY